MRSMVEGLLQALYGIESDAAFDRILKLLARLDRKPRTERGFREGGRRLKWTFEMAIMALGRRLEALGLLPPGFGEGAARKE